RPVIFTLCATKPRREGGGVVLRPAAPADPFPRRGRVEGLRELHLDPRRRQPVCPRFTGPCAAFNTTDRRSPVRRSQGRRSGRGAPRRPDREGPLAYLWATRPCSSLTVTSLPSSTPFQNVLLKPASNGP